MQVERTNVNRDVTDKEKYQQLGQRWYDASDDPIALLRSQNQLTTPWILAEIRKYIGYHAEILDIGCGAGFFANEAAKAEHKVTGVDIAENALQVAAAHDETKSVRYMAADAYALPFARESFDVVVAMDLLEHVSDPQKIIFEASRVLRPGGLFFFRTFNRNRWSFLFVIEGMQWFVKNTTRETHVYSLFRKPQEVDEWVNNAGMDIQIMRGTAPIIFQKAFWKLLRTREVPKNFKFKWTKSTSSSYLGYAKKLREH